MNSLPEKLLLWYEENARQLPWRDIHDPYATWVSEVMLQQTRVETVIPYYLAWMLRFPTIHSLANASEQDVLAAWEGLGYYSRARNLHKAAQKIVVEFGGEFPEDFESLRKLPGIGAYTAGAVASIAFGKDIPAIDGNVKRVFSRLLNLEMAIDSPKAQEVIVENVRKYQPHSRAGDFNQALMDLSAAICLPKVPHCSVCPLKEFCQAYASGVQTERPIRKERRPIPHHTVTAAVIKRNNKYLITRRPSKGLLGGLWEFPGGKVEKGETLPGCLEREIKEELGVQVDVGVEYAVFKHAYTHYRITLHAFLCQIISRNLKPLVADEIAWVRSKDLKKYPMGKVDRQIALQLEARDG